LDDYYIYIHRKKTTGEIFYVGKGKGVRCDVKSHRSAFWKSVVNRHGYTSTVILAGLDEDIAFEFEKAFIDWLGRRIDGTGVLVNLTEGGEGSSGYSHSDVAKEKIRQHRIGNKLSVESRQKLSRSTKGRKFSEKAKLANLQKTVRPVVRSDGVVFKSIQEAVDFLQKETGRIIQHSNISSVVRGKSRTAYGFKWQYLPKKIDENIHDHNVQ